MYYYISMNENETIEFEGRQYVNPDISRDEQMAFIDTMRDIQAQNNAQIATETHNLGTDVEPIRGGLSGSEEYWKSKYQTPQTDALVSNMKAVAQQAALNTALSNYQNMLQNRYNQAYRNYQKRASKYSGGGGGGNSPYTDLPDGDVEEDTYEEITAKPNPEVAARAVATTQKIMNATRNKVNKSVTTGNVFIDALTNPGRAAANLFLDAVEGRVKSELQKKLDERGYTIKLK